GGMRPALISSEYYVSFDQPAWGAVFGEELRRMTEEGRITTDLAPLLQHTEVAIDIGAGSHAACVIFQLTKGGSLRVLEALQSTNGGTPELVRELLRRDYSYSAWHWPHDAGSRSTHDNTSAIGTAIALGMPRNWVREIPRTKDVGQDIEYVRLN